MKHTDQGYIISEISMNNGNFIIADSLHDSKYIAFKDEDGIIFHINKSLLTKLNNFMIEKNDVYMSKM